MTDRNSWNQLAPGIFYRKNGPRADARGPCAFYLLVQLHLVGTSCGSFASASARKLTPSAAPPLPSPAASLDWGWGPPGGARSGPWRPTPAGLGPLGTPSELKCSGRQSRPSASSSQSPLELRFRLTAKNCVRSLLRLSPYDPLRWARVGTPTKTLVRRKAPPTCGGAPKRPHDRTGPGQMPGALVRSIYLYSSTRRVRCS